MHLALTYTTWLLTSLKTEQNISGPSKQRKVLGSIILSLYMRTEWGKGVVRKKIHLVLIFCTLTLYWAFKWRQNLLKRWADEDFSIKVSTKWPAASCWMIHYLREVFQKTLKFFNGICHKGGSCVPLTFFQKQILKAI